ncbi:hypothetical protein, partial [Paracoccus sp. (in: a-proteobacteria)]|uniref:hypothetical protein n=1 Tax=Paracoccus sp. TaxID=267 RepID=UPI003A85075F
MIIHNLIHDGRGYQDFSIEELIEAGVPQAAIDAALAKERREEIKAECARRIFTHADAPTQQNM